MQCTILLLANTARQQSFKRFAKVMHGVIGGSAKKRGRAVSTYWKATEGMGDAARIATAVEAYRRVYPAAAKRSLSYKLSKPASPNTIRKVMKAVGSKANKVAKKAKNLKKIKKIKKVKNVKKAKIMKKILKLKKSKLPKKSLKVSKGKSAKKTKGSGKKSSGKKPNDYIRFVKVLWRSGHIKGKATEKIKKIAKLWRNTKNVPDFQQRVEKALVAARRSS